MKNLREESINFMLKEFENVLVKISKSRENKNVGDYKTLTDSLKLLVSMLANLPNSTNINRIYNDLEKIIQKLEIEKIALENLITFEDSTKNHRDLLISYDRIIDCHDRINYIINKNTRNKALLQYKTKK